MKKSMITVMLLMLLLISICGMVSASPGPEVSANPGNSIKPVFSTDAKQTMTIWMPGTLSFVHVNSPACTIDRYANAARFWIPGESEGYFVSPFTLPSYVNNRPTSIRYIYLRLTGNPAIPVVRAVVFSGNSPIADNPMSRPGTGAEETVTIDLGAWYPIPKSLSITWGFRNNETTPRYVDLHGTGTKIKYRVT